MMTMTDKERYRQGLVRKLHYLVELLEDAQRVYDQDHQLKRDMPELSLWFPDRIEKLRQREQGAANPDTASSAVRIIENLAQAFDVELEWYKAGNIRLASVHVSSLATAYSLLAENEPLADIHRKRAEEALAHT